MHTDFAETSCRHPSAALSVINLISEEAPTDHELQQSSNRTPIHELISERLSKGRSFFAIELSPQMFNNADTELDFNTFKQRTGLPLFASITWMAPANVHHEPIIDAPALKLARSIRTAPVLTHITCGDLTLDRLDQIISTDDDGDAMINNILALRGDYVSPAQPLSHAVQLVRTIKRSKPNISIAVGGYPDVHPDAESASCDIQYLKEKVESGADFIITQLCFSADVITAFISRCRSIGIAVPIVVGIFVPTTFRSMVGMCRACRVRVPDDIFVKSKRFESEPEEFRKFSIEHTRSLIRDVMNREVAIGFQLFTLNRFDVVLDCLEGMNLGVE